MSNGDYGYFGKGDTGYAQYMTVFNRNFGGSSGGGNNNNGGGGGDGSGAGTAAHSRSLARRWTKRKPRACRCCFCSAMLGMTAWKL